MPYAYPATVQVYTDLGNLGGMTNEEANDAAAFGFGQWSSVATSSFSATVVGDFASIGLPDITGANAREVVGADNGGIIGAGDSTAATSTAGP